MISYNLQKCVTIIVLHISATCYYCKQRVNFDVYFDDGKFRRVVAEQDIEKKENNKI